MSTLFWQNKRVLVTGGSGFLGSHVVQVLQQRSVQADQLRIPRRATDDLRVWEHCRRVVEGQDKVYSGHSDAMRLDDYPHSVSSTSDITTYADTFAILMYLP
jgi:uncharacterized protein YbjT (DUF2867 family)